MDPELLDWAGSLALSPETGLSLLSVEKTPGARRIRFQASGCEVELELTPDAIELLAVEPPIGMPLEMTKLGDLLERAFDGSKVEMGGEIVRPRLSVLRGGLEDGEGL